MTLNRNTWSDEERGEYDAVLAEVLDCSKNTTERLDLFERRLNDALQAQRTWASDIERHARRDGLGAELRRFQARNKALVSWKGEVLTLPRVQGVRAQTTSGEMYYQQELIELVSWEQIATKRREALKARGTYTSKIAHYDRLLALRDLCPESTSPADAAKRLGTTIEAWLMQTSPLAA